jgi:DNA-binding GntR family transcriptional regulator
MTISQTLPFKTEAEELSFRRAEAATRRIVADQHDRPSLVPDIASHIGAQIVEGIRGPGEDLNTVDLAKQYKTSRTPVREALMLLEKPGLVDILPRRRPRVMVFDPQHVSDIYRTRSALLELTAADIVRQATDEQIGLIERAVERMEANMHDLHAYAWATVDFQDVSTEIAGNRFVKRIVESLLLKTLPLRRLSLSQPGRIRRSLDEHVRLVTAYRERDAFLAVALVRATHRVALGNIEGLLRSRDTVQH